MIDILTVGAHDAKKVASDLVRLLEAEEHTVRLLVGRQSESAIEEAKTARSGVVIIWSEDAPSQSYMREWLRQIDAARLIEIATSPGWPERKDRKAPVIDFSNWRGVRGGRAWNALSDRLKVVTRALEPPKPPPRHAALALGVASVIAVSVAAGVRNNQGGGEARVDTPTPHEHVELDAPTVAVGGAIIAVEPASAEDLSVLAPIRPLNIAPIHVAPVEFTRVDLDPIPDVRDPTLIERLQQFNPLARADETDSPAAQ